jgi:TolB-like protein/Tfp pilus assembly protein PilF
MKTGKKGNTAITKYPPGSLMGKLRKRKILATLAAFAGSGVVIIELAHHILVNHYHFPHQIVDICIVTLTGALIATLFWQWFKGTEKRPGNIKVEVLVTPLIILIILAVDLKLLFVMTGTTINTLFIGIITLSLGIFWIVIKSLQWAAGVNKRDETRGVSSLKEEKPSFPPSWKNSIAVLPFSDLSPQKNQEYFCDGISEELINTLTRIKDLRVVARTSAFSFKNKELDIREIGKKLDVNMVLEGSVRKEANRLRITAQLVNVADGCHLWSERYDREMKDIFAIQDEISLAIVNNLKVRLLDKERTHVLKRHTNDLEAYNLYLRGIHCIGMLTAEGNRKAMEYFERSLQRDPQHALTYYGMSMLYMASAFWANMPPHEAYPKMKEYAQKVIEIDDSIGLAHSVLGCVSAHFDWNWKKAEQEFKQALRLNRNFVMTHEFYYFLLTLCRRHEEAIAEAKFAQKLDPLSGFINTHVGHAYFNAGLYDNAIAELRTAITINPNYHLAHYVLGMAYLGKSVTEKALQEFEKSVELSNNAPWEVMNLSLAYYDSGQKVQAEKLFKSLEQRSKKEYVPPMCFFYIYHVQGELGRSFDWLKTACEKHDSWLPWCIVNPVERYHIPTEPKYRALLKKAGLELT